MLLPKPSRETKNMITVEMLDDGNGNDCYHGTKGFVSKPYWNLVQPP